MLRMTWEFIFYFFYSGCMCFPWALRALSSCGQCELPVGMWDFSSWARDFSPIVPPRKSQEWPENLFFGGHVCFFFPCSAPPFKPKEVGSEKTAQWPQPPWIQGPHVCPKGKCAGEVGQGAGWVVVAASGGPTRGHLCGRAGLVQLQCSTGSWPAKSTSSTSAWWRRGSWAPSGLLARLGSSSGIYLQIPGSPGWTCPLGSLGEGSFMM